MIKQYVLRVPQKKMEKKKMNEDVLEVVNKYWM